MPRMSRHRVDLHSELAGQLFSAFNREDHYLCRILGHKIPAGQVLWAVRTQGGWDYHQTTQQRGLGERAVLLTSGPLEVEWGHLLLWVVEVEGRIKTL